MLSLRQSYGKADRTVLTGDLCTAAVKDYYPLDNSKTDTVTLCCVRLVSLIELVPNL